MKYVYEASMEFFMGSKKTKTLRANLSCIKSKKKYIIVCQRHLGHFLLKDDCACQMIDGSFFQFGYECLGKLFLYHCLSVALEIMKIYCRYKFFNKQFFFF